MRSNRQFGLEQEMSGPVLRWLKNQNLIAKAEYRTPWGLCDFVGLEFNTARCADRVALGQKQPIGTPLRIALFNTIPEGSDGITLHALHRLYGDLLSRDQLEREINSLQKGGFVASNKRSRFYKINGWAPLHNRIVAVELKLHRIEEALAQAQSHLAFATESYVAFPFEVARRIVDGSRSDAFRALGVGVISVTATSCKVLLPSQNSRNVDPVLQMHCTERFWRTHITNSAS